VLSWLALGVAACSKAPTGAVVWTVENTATIGGHPVTVVGAPKISDTEHGRAVCFNGVDEGLVVEANPLAGLAEFTLEVLFKPEPGGAPEQRFVHMAEDGSENRALVELRMAPEGPWYLDTYLHKDDAKLALVRPETKHAAGTWYWAALTYRDGHMRHFVNGVEEAAGAVRMAPLGGGKTSIGVRLNRVSWFRGCIREVRVTETALGRERLQKP
jgi:hypothetical protein